MNQKIAVVIGFALVFGFLVVIFWLLALDIKQKGNGNTWNGDEKENNDAE